MADDERQKEQAIVRAGDRGLTTRSASIVKRGLEHCAAIESSLDSASFSAEKKDSNFESLSRQRAILLGKRKQASAIESLTNHGVNASPAVGTVRTNSIGT